VSKATTSTKAPGAVVASDPWKQAMDLEQSGEAVEIVVKRFNKGGQVAGAAGEDALLNNASVV
jgi:hypothetical protein